MTMFITWKCYARGCRTRKKRKTETLQVCGGRESGQKRSSSESRVSPSRAKESQEDGRKGRLAHDEKTVIRGLHSAPPACLRAPDPAFAEEGSSLVPSGRRI
ncbi:hypothetical protein NDU88_001992 [Pleurodeles waltl]|uniref:Uncharacterized protein n=1 Tax=Pleurodeles waltl TaxID=8319 RepID=A0AAV7RAM6_PLEWA|nr:hypothetical protein NDU88_001992 [Pleurodeles waltl]